MSNRNFDYRVITDRLNSINIAQNIYKYQQNGKNIISNPQTSNSSTQRITEYREGVQELISKNLGSGYTVNPSGILNLVIASNAPVNNAPIFVVPSAPTITDITPGNQELIVDFNPPISDGGSAITDYEYSIDNGVLFTSSGIIISPITITGLTNGNSYDIIIRAINSVGSGASSNMITAIPSTIPSPPTIMSIIRGDQQLFVNFTEGYDGGSSIINYKYSIDNGYTFTAFNPPTGPETLVLITGLTNGIRYYIVLRAVNLNGDSSSSNPLSGIPSTEPSPPTGLIGSAGNQQATISFTPGDDGGSPIVNYQYSIDDGTTFTAFNPSTGEVSSVIITGLTNGITYNIKLKAVNIDGVSFASSTVIVTPSTTPSAPTITSITPGNQQLTINFTAGSDSGSSITNYKYSLNGGAFTAFSPADTVSPVIITGLTNGTLYNVVLRAVNSNGDSSSSNSESGTPSTTPSAPTGLTGSPGNQQATISFTAGSNGGSAITNYKYSTDNGSTFRDFSPVDTSSPVIITTLSSDGTTPLSNGTPYSIQLKAVNANGESPASSTVIVTPALIDQIQASLTTSLAAYNAAANDDWVAITSTEYTNLQSNITGTAKVGLADTYLLGTSGTNASGFSQNKAALVSNSVTALNTAIAANNYLYGFAFRYVTTIPSAGMRVYTNTNINSTGGYNQVGNILPSVSTVGISYFVRKGVTTTNGATAGLLGLFSGTKMDYPGSFSSSGGYFGFNNYGTPTPPVMRYLLNDGSVPASNSTLSSSIPGYGAFQIQGLITATKQWS